MIPERLAFLAKQRALALGFDAAGVTDLAPSQYAGHLEWWLAEGMDAGMTYMQRQVTERGDPRTIAPGATRALVVTERPSPRRRGVQGVSIGNRLSSAICSPCCSSMYC